MALASIFSQQQLYQNYQNRTTIVKDIVGGWVVYFFCNTVYKNYIVFQTNVHLCIV